MEIAGRDKCRSIPLSLSLSLSNELSTPIKGQVSQGRFGMDEPNNNTPSAVDSLISLHLLVVARPRAVASPEINKLS